MPNSTQLSQQSFFSLTSSVISTPQSVQIPGADSNIPDINFGGRLVSKTPNLWQSNTSRFCVPSRSSAGPVVDTSPIYAQPHGLPTPESPFNALPNQNYHYNSFSGGSGMMDFKIYHQASVTWALTSTYMFQNCLPTHLTYVAI
jgi:hypothetical protein